MRGVWLGAALACVAACGRFGFHDQPGAPGGASSVDAAPDALDVPVVGLVAHWSFDSISGTAFADATGNHAAACTTGNCPTTQAGVVGDAAHFDGTTSCLTVASLATWRDPSFTISAWVTAPEQQNGSAASNTGPIVVHESINGCPSPELAMSNAGKGLGLVQINTGGSNHNEAWTPNMMSASVAWHHVAVMWDGTKQTVYVDGACTCHIAPPLGPLDNPQPFTIGCYPTNGNQHYAGGIDELRIYSRALNPVEVGQLYAEGGGSGTPAACSATCATTAP